jgi:ParB family chromosome partitioning protein
MSPKQRGLGRGLDALFEDEEKSFVHLNADPEAHVPDAQRKTLGVGQLSPDPQQPRTFFDDRALAELADSIKVHGVLQPILVRPHKTIAGQYEIIAGERRWRAAQKAQLHEVPVIIRDLDDAAALQIALIENLQRQDLNAIEEAKGYQRLMDEFTYSQEDVAEVVGKSRSYVANIVRLLQLPSSVQGMVGKNELSAGHARALINAANPTQLAQEVISKGLSVRQTEKLAADTAGRDIKSRTPGVRSADTIHAKDADTLALEKQLSNALGLNVTLDMKDAQNGTLHVAYRTLDQLDHVIKRLLGN